MRRLHLRTRTVGRSWPEHPFLWHSRGRGLLTSAPRPTTPSVQSGRVSESLPRLCPQRPLQSSPAHLVQSRALISGLSLATQMLN